ncbi:MAG: hypothetical protein DCC57_08310 [Chloroflexi bacterium]|nr:MAG: hypothetical protein DCC57_08310 [Chloroflexota bacterium]
MSFLKRWIGGSKPVDGDQLARSAELQDYAQIDLLAHFAAGHPPPSAGEQNRWSRILPHPYPEMIRHFEKLGWLESSGSGQYRVAATAQPYVAAYRDRLARDKAEIMPKVREALAQKDTNTAFALRRAYEASFPMGKADWTGPEPQLSHSALTRRIFFLDHWLLDGLSNTTQEWVKLYAAEQHLWGATWRLSPDEIPPDVAQELARPDMDAAEAAYWKAYQLALHVDNQETWQRCKGGDHVRRIALAGPNDEYTCEHCRSQLGKEFLVARVPELPHRGCTSPRGCRCRYEPVLEAPPDI